MMDKEKPKKILGDMAMDFSNEATKCLSQDAPIRERAFYEGVCCGFSISIRIVNGETKFPPPNRFLDEFKKYWEPE